MPIKSLLKPDFILDWEKPDFPPKWPFRRKEKSMRTILWYKKKKPKQLFHTLETIVKAVRSSNLKKIWYNLARKQMEIQFKDGSVYRYYYVEWQTHRAILKAKSHGKAFWRLIRRQFYPYLKVK